MTREEKKKYIIENYVFFGEVGNLHSEMYIHRTNRLARKYKYVSQVDYWVSIPYNNSILAFGQKITADWMISALRAMAFPRGVKKPFTL